MGYSQDPYGGARHPTFLQLLLSSIPTHRGKGTVERWPELRQGDGMMDTSAPLQQGELTGILPFDPVEISIWFPQN